MHFRHKNWPRAPLSQRVTLAGSAACLIWQSFYTWRNPEGICVFDWNQTSDLSLPKRMHKPLQYGCTFDMKVLKRVKVLGCVCGNCAAGVQGFSNLYYNQFSARYFMDLDKKATTMWVTGYLLAQFCSCCTLLFSQVRALTWSNKLVIQRPKLI